MAFQCGRVRAFPRRDLGLVFLKKVCRSGVFIERPSLKLLDPDRIRLSEMSWRFARLWSVSPVGCNRTLQSFFSKYA
jgi:hypothetical protein